MERAARFANALFLWCTAQQWSAEAGRAHPGIRFVHATDPRLRHAIEDRCGSREPFMADVLQCALDAELCGPATCASELFVPWPFNGHVSALLLLMGCYHRTEFKRSRPLTPAPVQEQPPKPQEPETTESWLRQQGVAAPAVGPSACYHILPQRRGAIMYASPRSARHGEACVEQLPTSPHFEDKKGGHWKYALLSFDDDEQELDFAVRAHNAYAHMSGPPGRRARLLALWRGKAAGVCDYQEDWKPEDMDPPIEGIAAMRAKGHLCCKDVPFAERIGLPLATRKRHKKNPVPKTDVHRAVDAELRRAAQRVI